MAIAIRLARGGAKKRPYYRIVVADSRMPRDGRYIEKVGTYNPMLAKDDEKRVILLEDRVKHWLAEGAKPSDRVSRFLEAACMAEKKVRNNPNKAKPGQKALDLIFIFFFKKRTCCIDKTTTWLHFISNTHHDIFLHLFNFINRWAILIPTQIGITTPCP